MELILWETEKLTYFFGKRPRSSSAMPYYRRCGFFLNLMYHVCEWLFFMA